MSSFTPWVEKYRPNTFDEIVLDPLNKKILENIIKEKYFPNLLFYGPPGTGKTTSIINLIKSFQSHSNSKNLMIHLNASDERGIDIIRNQINSFVNSKSLFNNGMKFVVLDEVDYMTKNAQIALRYLLQGYNSNVRFCLICNYISRIDEALQNEFMRLRFNQLPEYDIIRFLKNINEKEELNFGNDSLQLIQQLFNSDIRSMINYMQSNELLINEQKIIKEDLWEKLILNIQKEDLDYNIKMLNIVSIDYNIEKINILKNFLNYIIRHKNQFICREFLLFVEHIMHISNCNQEYLLGYSIIKLQELLHID